MRTHLTLLQGALVVLLVVTACLFAVGSTIERHHRHHESAAAKTGETTGESGSESGNESSKPSEHAKGEAGARLLGVDTESLGLSTAAVVASLLLAAAVWLRPARLVLLAVAGFGLVFAAGDGRELVHQLDDSNGGLAAVAALLLALHVAVAALAVLLLSRRATDRGALPEATR